MLRAYIRLFALLAMGFFCSCDVDLFGNDTKKIGRNYQLVKVDWPGEFEFSAPDHRQTEVVSKIGWQKPLIIVQAHATDSWKVIDTGTGKRATISEEQRRNDPRYAAIQIYSAAEAWHLPKSKRRW